MSDCDLKKNKTPVFDKILNLELYSLLFYCVVSLPQQFEKQTTAYLCPVLKQAEVLYSNASACKWLAGGVLRSFQQKMSQVALWLEKCAWWIEVGFCSCFPVLVFFLLYFSWPSPAHLTIFCFKIFFLKSTLTSVAGIFWW